MKDGTTTVSSTISFYDSQGAAVGATNYWNNYYRHNEEFVHTFKPGTSGYKVQVAFNTFTAYGPNPADPNSATGVSIGSWSIRLNDDFLYVYDGDRVDDTKLIAAYTGNSQQAFTIVATGSTGALTFVFKSNGQYREEGWAATVTQVGNATAQAPFIRRATCENEIEMLPTTLKAKIYYTIDGSNPSTSSTQYRRPINFPAGSLTVKAISVLSTGGDASSVASVTFADSEHLTNPGAPTVSDMVKNQVTMTAPAVPSGLNETYVVRYTMTTDGSTPANPTLYNGTEYTGPITITEPGTKIRARTFAKSCDNWYSITEDTSASGYDGTNDGIIEKTFSTLTCPAPTITMNATEQSITFDGNYNLSYTTDDSTPTSTHGTQVTGDGSASQNVTIPGLNSGDVVRAITYKDGYTSSEVVIMYYSTGTSMTSTTVFLDDREDHKWSYYSDGDQPIHSLNPADVKITYYGNGTRTVSSTSNNAIPGTNSWTGNATSAMVGINPGESQNTFVYLKTLERQNEDGSGNLPYTMIANPFQVRPIYRNSKGTDDIAPIINIIEPEPQAIPEPVFVDPIIPEEMKFSAEKGNRSGTFTEDFEGTVTGWDYDNNNNLFGGGIHTQDPEITTSGTGDFNMGTNNKFLYFQADGRLVTTGYSMAVMPYYANIESISFRYQVTTAATFFVGWYNNGDFQNSGAVALTRPGDDPVTYTINSSTAAALLNNVNGSENGRIAFYLYATGTTERDAGIDDIVITFTPKAPGFNYSDGISFTGTSASVTITRRDPNTVTYYKICAADDDSDPDINTWTRFDGNSQTVTVPANTPRLRAFAYHEPSGTFSAVTDATYIFTLRAPTFSHNGGHVNSTSQPVTITGLDANTTVYYTMDGSDPLTSSTASNFPGGSSVTVTMGDDNGQIHTQLRAIAVANNLATLTSAETSATYSFNLNPPTISPAGGLYFANSLNVTITGDATTYYTLDGSEPTTSSEHTVPSSGSVIVTINSTTTVKAKTFSAFGQSEVVEQTYSLMPDVTNANQYRGFYAWRVKSLSSGLTITDGTTTYGVGSTIDADKQIYFVTNNEYGNKVEFEALWALAYVVNADQNGANNITAQNVGRERNFVVLTTGNNYAYGGYNGRRIGNDASHQRK